MKHCILRYVQGLECVSWGGAVLVTLFFSAGSQELLLVPDTFITQHTLGSVSSIQDLEVFKGSPQPERSSQHGSQLRWRRVEHTKCAGRSRELSDSRCEHT